MPPEWLIERYVLGQVIRSLREGHISWAVDFGMKITGAHMGHINPGPRLKKKQ
jgi:hypothetical protein